jgi:hypothetical protein
MRKFCTLSEAKLTALTLHSAGVATKPPVIFAEESATRGDFVTPRAGIVVENGVRPGVIVSVSILNPTEERRLRNPYSVGAGEMIERSATSPSTRNQTTRTGSITATGQGIIFCAPAARLHTFLV